MASPTALTSSSVASSLKKTVIPTVVSAVFAMCCTFVTIAKNRQNRKIQAAMVAVEAAENSLLCSMFLNPERIQ